MVSTQAFQGPYAVRVDAFFSMQTAPWVPRTRRRGSPATHFPSKPKKSNFQAFPNLPGDKGVGKTNLLYTMTSVFFSLLFPCFWESPKHHCNSFNTLQGTCHQILFFCSAITGSAITIWTTLHIDELSSRYVTATGCRTQHSCSISFTSVSDTGPKLSWRLQSWSSSPSKIKSREWVWKERHAGQMIDSKIYVTTKESGKSPKRVKIFQNVKICQDGTKLHQSSSSQRKTKDSHILQGSGS